MQNVASLDYSDSAEAVALTMTVNEQTCCCLGNHVKTFDDSYEMNLFVPFDLAGHTVHSDWHSCSELVLDVSGVGRLEQLPDSVELLSSY